MIAAQEDALAVVHSADAGLPLIVVEGDLSGRGLSVGVDQIDGARQATQHLIDLGHRAIDHVAGPADLDRGQGPPHRLRGGDARRRTRLRGSRWEGDWTPARGYEIGRELARRGDMTAVFVANDQMAIGVLHAFAEARAVGSRRRQRRRVRRHPRGRLPQSGADHRPPGLPGHRSARDRPGHRPPWTARRPACRCCPPN